MRVILECHHRTHVEDMLNSLHWLSVRQRFKYNVLCVMWKIHNNIVPDYINFFQNNDDVHGHITRQASRGDIRGSNCHNKSFSRIGLSIGTNYLLAPGLSVVTTLLKRPWSETWNRWLLSHLDFCHYGILIGSYLISRDKQHGCHFLLLHPGFPPIRESPRLRPIAADGPPGSFICGISHK